MDRELNEPTAAARHHPEAPHAHPAGPEPESLPSAVGNAAFTRLVRAGGIQRAGQSHGAGPLDPDIAAAIDTQRGGGATLPDTTRTEMEHHLGHDLSAVRVHTDSGADALNRSVQAEAFTSGTDVFFAAGRYDPASRSGKSLLAHELTHVVQQSTGTAGEGSRVSHPDEPAEVRAKSVGEAVAAAPVARQEFPEEDEAAEAGVQRQEAAVPEEEEEEPPAPA
jgi:hypothetical protein